MIYQLDIMRPVLFIIIYYVASSTAQHFQYGEELFCIATNQTITPPVNILISSNVSHHLSLDYLKYDIS
jgi:hypothetical protein